MTARFIDTNGNDLGDTVIWENERGVQAVLSADPVNWKRVPIPGPYKPGSPDPLGFAKDDRQHHDPVEADRQYDRDYPDPGRCEEL